MTDKTDALPEPDTNTLLFIIADIRIKSGVGDQPMLTDLADVIADKIKATGTVKPRVKPLKWERGAVDYARPIPGMKYVACSQSIGGKWAWWLDGDETTRQVRGSELAAKAAAQADYEARILAVLEGE
jgi:hypothetical protein